MTLSTVVLLMVMGVCPTPCNFLQSTLSSLVLLRLRCQGSQLLSVTRLVAVGDQADDEREQSVEERAEHTALGCAGVESQRG